VAPRSSATTRPTVRSQRLRVAWMALLVRWERSSLSSQGNHHLGALNDCAGLGIAGPRAVRGKSSLGAAYISLGDAITSLAGTRMHAPVMVPCTMVPFLSSIVTVSFASFMRKRTNFILQLGRLQTLS
jgi:hypothetical protein